MKIHKRTIAIAVGAIILISAFIGIQAVRARWNQPLAPELSLPTQAPTSTTAPVMETSSLETIEGTAESITTEILATNTPKPKPLCGGPETMTILAIGSDSRSDNYLYGLADVIRIVRVDFMAPRITVLSIPRDIWVEIPGIEDHHGITHGKLNQAFFYGNPGMGYYDGLDAGPGLLALTLNDNFDLWIDHYIAVNMMTFEGIVDAVGGIDIYLPQSVDGRPVDEDTEDMGFFPAGQHHFNGNQALRFSRIRKQDNGFMRMDRQTQVLCSLRDELLSPSVVGDIPKLIKAFQGRILTDLSMADLSKLACLGPKVGTKNLIFARLPEEMLRPGRNDKGSFIWVADFDKVRDIISEFVAGTWPLESERSTSISTCP